MGRLAEIDADLHELPDFEKGVQFERERIINELKRTTTRFEIPLQAGELKELWENFLRDNIIKIINLEVENSGNKE